MIEIKITVELPGIPDALNNLAHAIAEKAEIGKILSKASHEAQPVQIPAQNAPVQPVQPVPAVQPTTLSNAPATPSDAPAMPSDTPVASSVQQTVIPAAQPAAKPVTMNDLSLAGARLVDAGKMDAVINALKNFGVVAITQLQEDQYSSFAECLRALGADI